MALVHPLLYISQGSNVQGGVRQSGVNPGEGQQTEDSIDYTTHQQVPVVGSPLFQPTKRVQTPLDLILISVLYGYIYQGTK